MPVPQARAVRLIVRLGAHGRARRAGDGAGAARFAGHGAGGAGGAGRAAAVVADHVLAADGAVRLGLLGVRAAGAAWTRRSWSRRDTGWTAYRPLRRCRGARRFRRRRRSRPPPPPPARRARRPCPRYLRRRRGRARARKPPQANPEADQKQASEYAVCPCPSHSPRFKSEDCRRHPAPRDRGRRPAPARRPSAPPGGRDSARTARTTRTRPRPAPRPWRNPRSTA